MRNEPIPTFDCYRELGVASSADRDQIEAAFRALALRHHPDTADDPIRATARMTRLNIARTWLVDPARRARYDAVRGRAAITGAGPLRSDQPEAWPEEPPRPAADLLRNTIAMIAFMVLLASLILGFGTLLAAAVAIVCALVLASFGVAIALEFLRPSRRD